MATAKKLPSGNWRVQVFSHKDENGKNKYISFTAPTKVEAQRKAAEFQANKFYEDKPQDVTIKYAIESYIDARQNSISPKTRLTYKSYMQYYTPLINIRIGSLSTLDLQRFVDNLNKTLNPKTVKNVYSLLKSSIEQYTDRSFKVKLLPVREPKRHIPTDADVKVMLEKANPNLKIAIVLGSNGMRRGEIASLKYKDILYDFNAIYIHSDLVLGEEGWEYKDPPKTPGSVRRLTLPKEVIEMLGHGDPEEYVLGILPSTITSDFINLRNKLGLKCRFHDLRHYMASILHAIGVPDVYIMERGGWTSDNVLKSVYRNSLSDKSIHFTSVANDYFMNKIMGNNDNEKNEKKA